MIVGPIGTFLEFTIGFLELEQSVNCTKDYVEVTHVSNLECDRKKWTPK